jgi:hypothetical protein
VESLARAKLLAIDSEEAIVAELDQVMGGAVLELERKDELAGRTAVAHEICTIIERLQQL